MAWNKFSAILGVLVLGLITITTSTPHPFRLRIETGDESFTASYLSCSSRVVPLKQASHYHFNMSGSYVPIVRTSPPTAGTVPPKPLTLTCEGDYDHPYSIPAADVNGTWIPFTPSDEVAPHAITTSFGVSNESTLSWQNDRFLSHGGEVRFGIRRKHDGDGFTHVWVQITDRIGIDWVDWLPAALVVEYVDLE